MRPLTQAALGLALVLADLRVGSLDVLPDPVGWVLVLVGLWPLRSRHTGLVVAVVAGVVMVPVSVPSVFVDPADVGALLDLADLLVEAVFFFALLTAVRALTYDGSTRRTASIIRAIDVAWSLLGLALLVVLGETDASYQVDGAGSALILVLLLAVTGALVGALVWLHRVGEQEPFLPTFTPA